MRLNETHNKKGGRRGALSKNTNDGPYERFFNLVIRHSGDKLSKILTGKSLHGLVEQM